MNKIKDVLYLYKLDWKRIFKNPMAVFLIVALMILPSLYAWFNIEALWDPYGNTSELPIAVYSADEGTNFQGKEINVGKEVTKTLHDNHQLGWRFVKSKDALVSGVKSGKYYAGIYLPEEFSKDLVSFTNGTIKKPEIGYYSNEKINAIAPKITEKGASSLQSQISEEFIATASSTLLDVFNEIGYDIDSNLVSINKIKNMILQTDGQIDTIDGYTQEVLALQEDFPEIKAKVAKAEAFADYIPQIDQLGNKVVMLDKKMPTIKEQASVILTLQKKIPEIQQAGQQIKMIDDDFEQIEATLTDGIDSAKQGLEVLDKVQNAMPTIEKLGGQAGDVAETSKEFAQQLQSALPSITASVDTTIESISNFADTMSSVATTIENIVADNELTPEKKAALKEQLNALNDQLTAQQQVVANLRTFLENLNAKQPSDTLKNGIEQLKNVETALGILASKIAAVDVDQLSTADLEQLLTDINTATASVKNSIQIIQSLNLTEKTNELLTELITAIDTAQNLLKTIDYDQLNQLIQSTKGTVSGAVAILEKYQKEMPAIYQEVHDANTMLNGHMDEIVAGINSGASLYRNELPVLEEKLSTAADFIQNDWPDIKDEITTTTTMIDEKLPQVESAVDAAASVINNDWPTLKTGIHKAATAIKKGEQEVDLGEVIKLLKLDAQQEADFFKHPVEINENRIYPIPNNGSASTPFYTVLCLWVGSLLLASLATTDYYLEKGQKQFSKRTTFVARMLTFLTVAIGQSVIVTLGNMFLLDVYIKNPVYSTLFTLLTGLTFMMIIYVLVGLFGNVGKGIGIIILVLSISGGGGNYPIQVSGKFFQLINPFLPFTHAVALLREAAGGIYWANAITQLIILFGLFLFFGIIGTYLYPYIIDKTEKLERISKESHFFH